MGRFFIFCAQVIVVASNSWPDIKKLCVQLNTIGVGSFSIVLLTGTFTGMVFALQAYVGFQRVGGEQFIGSVVALGIIRELGPVLTGLMVTGRACSAIAAEIGTMAITEQLDALITLRINPFRYLVVPRILAGVIAVPCLALFAMLFGILGGYGVCVYILELSSEDYLGSIKHYVEMSDIMSGLIKASFFGLLLTCIGTYKGFYAQGGARGVGIATTQAVVVSSVSILISDYIFTKIIERL